MELLKPRLPETDDIEKLTEIKISYPRTVVYNFEKINFIKPASFDSIAFKQEEKKLITEYIKNNIFTELLSGANISYQYIFTDKNQQYLSTLDISPEDYQ